MWLVGKEGLIFSPMINPHPEIFITTNISKYTTIIIIYHNRARGVLMLGEEIR